MAALSRGEDRLSCGRAQAGPAASVLDLPPHRLPIEADQVLGLPGRQVEALTGLVDQRQQRLVRILSKLVGDVTHGSPKRFARRKDLAHREEIVALRDGSCE